LLDHYSSVVEFSSHTRVVFDLHLDDGLISPFPRYRAFLKFFQTPR